MAVEWNPAPVAILCPIAPPCGRLTAELECLGSLYTHTPQHQQQMGLTNLEQQDYDTDPFRQGLTPPQMPGDHMHPYGKRLQWKSNVEFIGLCPSVFKFFHFFLTLYNSFFFLGFKGLYPETDPLCHLTDSDCLPLGDSSLLTPIDRLCSMQDSYFTSWEWALGGPVLFTLHLSIRFPSFTAPFRKSEPGRCGHTVTTCNKLCAPPHSVHVIIQGAMYALSNLTSDLNSGI